MINDPEVIMNDQYDDKPREWNADNLADIRCPRERYFPKYKSMMVCNYKCAEVFPGSSGRAFCSRCRPTSSGLFWYDVDINYKPPEVKRIIKANKKK